MWLRRLLCAVVLAAVAAPAPGPAEAAPAGAHARPAKKKVTRGKAKRTARKRHKSARRTSARPGKRTASNMPEGWSWPPSKEMIAAGKRCTDRLDELGIVWKPASALERIATPIIVPSMTFGDVKLVSVFRPPPFVMDCHLALALTTFAKDLHELGVRELHFSRIYGYTLVRANGVTKNALSRHALGLAMDVRSVFDDTGHESVVATDYVAGDPLLVRLEEFLNDSGGFRTVLTPKNDPISHHDHFHVEVKLDY